MEEKLTRAIGKMIVDKERELFIKEMRITKGSYLKEIGLIIKNM